MKSDTDISVTVLVIPTTHWDRAWYWPAERFRIKLIEMWSAVKELWEKHPDYTFNADGQALCVEDYLEIFPQDTDLFRRMGTEGRLKLGALYCQSDLYCTGGEALIRNLLAGQQVADELEAGQGIVYMPDTFGHIPSIPMICQGFGIDTYTFMRGVSEEVNQEDRFWFWESRDGSRIQIFRMRDGYANGARLGLHRGTGEIMDKDSSGIKPSFDLEMAVEQITAAALKQRDAMGEPYVLNAGVDHQIPQKQLSEIMNRAASEEMAFRYSTWDEVAEIMRGKDTASWSVYRGENHGQGAATVLGGTVSSRIYLKQLNAACERHLICQSEVLDAAAVSIGKADPSGKVIPHTWRRLLKCHPHDNITGCSVDAVHREDEASFAIVSQSADALNRRMASRILEVYGGQKRNDHRYAFFLFNGQASTHQRNLIVKIDHEGRLNWGDMPVHEYYDIVDGDGAPVPFREISRGCESEHPHPVLWVEMQVTLRPMTINRFFLEPRTSWAETRVTDVMENEFLLVRLNPNGSVCLTDKSSGVSHDNLVLFSDQADCGDEYDFSHIENDEEIVFHNLCFSRSGETGNNGLQFAAFTGELEVPSESNFAGRSPESSLLPVTVTYTLAPGQRQLDVGVSFTNVAKDHRLRLNLPLNYEPVESVAGLKFDTVKRSCNKRFMLAKGDAEYAIDPIHPTDHFVAATAPDSGNGLAVFAEFPVNYEVITGDRPCLAVTLLRAVGILSHENLTRGPGAGPDTLTPEAQCLGRRFDMRFGIRPFSKSDTDLIFAEAMRWRWMPAFGLVMGFDPELVEQKPEPLFVVDNKLILVSSFKQISRDGEDGGIILRLFNTSIEEQSCRLAVSRRGECHPIGLNEKTVENRHVCRNDDGTLNLVIAPRALLSLAVNYL